MSTPHSLPRRVVTELVFWLLRYVVWPATKIAFCVLVLAPIALLLYGTGEESRTRYQIEPAL